MGEQIQVKEAITQKTKTLKWSHSSRIGLCRKLSVVSVIHHENLTIYLVHFRVIKHQVSYKNSKDSSVLIMRYSLCMVIKKFIEKKIFLCFYQISKVFFSFPDNLGSAKLAGTGRSLPYASLYFFRNLINIKNILHKEMFICWFTG